MKLKTFEIIKTCLECDVGEESEGIPCGSCGGLGYFSQIKKYKNIVAYLERVHAFPTDGRSSAFKFGMNYGEWIGILASMRIETVLVTPQKWMKHFKEKFNIKLPKEKPQRKRKLKEIASQYTDRTITLYNADAILIAVYGLIQQTNRKEKECLM